MDRAKAVDDLFEAFCKAYPLRSRKTNQDAGHAYWKTIKDKPDWNHWVRCKLNELKQKAKSPGGTLMNFFATVPTSVQPADPATSSATAVKPAAVEPAGTRNDPEAAPTPTPQEAEACKHVCPRQEALRKELEALNAEICSLLLREKNGILSALQSKKLKEFQGQKAKSELDLKKLKADQVRQKEFRAQRKRVLENACGNNPELAKQLKIRKEVGRPCIESEQPLFIKTLIDIAQYGASADDRRRSETLRTVKTLDQLTEALQNAGFEACRSSVYYRLLPRNSHTTDGKRHVRAVPVKLAKPGKDLHHNHEDGYFCAATMHALDELASFLGPGDVAKISIDDKARVPLGIAAATAQAPLLMHMEYRVRLPDHDWAVADKHKLIPSVYAGVEIKKEGFGDKGAVTYSGPTHVSVRSGKHSKSTAYSHARDLDRVFELEEFKYLLTKPDGSTKPILILTVDGGPDENPRFQKNIEIAIHHFIKKKLDCLFIATNAPGRSAFNIVERRMAPLSRQLSGVVLSHEHFGSHLDSSGRTVDLELEKKNFQHAGECLAEIFSAVTIDGYPVTAEFVSFEESELDKNSIAKVSPEWISNHVRSSQYFLQIVKCNNPECCDPFRSAYLTYFKNRFLPAPIPLDYEQGLQVSANPSTKTYASLFQNLAVFNKNVPYDEHCPSLSGKLKARVCADCGIYFASNVLQKKHRAVHKGKGRKNRAAVKNEEDNVDDGEDKDTGESEPVAQEYDDSVLPVVSMEEHFSNPWTDDI